jgi:asparagine synthase (glutamine-hydrolysing)
MCGIAGIINKNSVPVDQKKLINMRDSLIHRGPDAAGIYIDNHIGFGHRRLSIIDLSENANQPFHSPCKRYTLTFNGEIFNYAQFKEDLSQKGFVFYTNSDTEVLLYLLMEQGVECLKKLIGFWAFSFYDHQQKTILIVRDRMGIKPHFIAILPLNLPLLLNQKLCLHTELKKLLMKITSMNFSFTAMSVEKIPFLRESKDCYLGISCSLILKDKSFK